ncbi:MAG: DUF3500 domain-containing protein [Fimbriimonadaceae bacterium]|nr:DUF3500 domain-containing protein [Fimbriimonadaceae bacterium]
MRFISAFVLLLVCLGFRMPHRIPRSGADELAVEFLNSLGTDLRERAQKQFGDDYRTLWRYVPAERQGVSLGQLSASQRALGVRLLKATLSDLGYRKIERIRELEDVLFELENKNKGRDKNYYLFTFFGTPSDQGKWGWRYEGHHLSLNFTYLDGKLVSSTPQFLGSNPANVTSGPHEGRTLEKEQDLAFALLETLTEGQRAKAVISHEAPNDIATSNTRKASILAKEGISYQDLTQGQRQRLMALVKIHAEVQSDAEQQRRLKRIEPASLVFAWMGSLKPGVGHYYRIQGSKFLIEYDNTQNNANHIHAVWRDFNGDFGEDILTEHYASSPHHHHH